MHFAQVNEMDGFFITAHEPDPAFIGDKLEGADAVLFGGGQPLAMFKYACHKAGITYGKINAINPGGPGKSTKRSATARAEKLYFPNIDEAILANCISTYQQLDVEITEAAYQATLGIFEYNGLITERFAYDQVCAKPQWGDRNSGNADLTPSAAHSTDHSHSTRSGQSPRTSKYWRARLPGPRRSGPFGLSRSGLAPSRYPVSHPVPTQA
jgi:hypothetical protein